MRINVLFREEQPYNVGFHQNETILNSDFGSIQTLTESNYEHLTNKPSINNVELIGALTAEDLGLGRVLYDTTANWEIQPPFITVRGAIYIYSDAYYIEDEVGNRTPIAGLKIGDGVSELASLPFINENVTALIISHITNTDIHVSLEEKRIWNSKVSVTIDRDDHENLVFTSQLAFPPASGEEF